MSRRSPHWTIYIGAALAVLTLAWQMAGGWFALVHRVERLEELQRYLHGDLSPFLRKD